MKEKTIKNIEVDEDIVAPFRYKEFNDGYLITNDFGFFEFLTVDEFKNFLNGSLKRSSEIFLELKNKGFVKDKDNLEKLRKRFFKRNQSLQHGPGLHIVVVSLRCNYNCVYCQASSRGVEEEDLDMDIETAEKVVDLIFEAENQKINIEFQGGEPLVNWEVVKFIINYAKEKEKTSNKKITFSLVTNFSLMDQEKLNFLIEKDINICTSLDGPRKIHNKNRPYLNGDSYKKVTKWIKKHREAKKGRSEASTSALLTVSRFSLQNPKKIIDEYRENNFSGVHLRPLSNLGDSSGDAKNKIGYSAEDFMKYWKESMDYILEINQKGEHFTERGSLIMLTKILTDIDPGYTDLSSPCGAVIGQIAYDYNGDIYTCDEGRMVEDDIFKLGHVDNVTYKDIVSCDLCKTMINASILENQSCDFCAYKPYCGVCPVKNYAVEEALFPHMQSTEWCYIKKSKLDYLFSKLKKRKHRIVFEEWIQARHGRM